MPPHEHHRRYTQSIPRYSVSRRRNHYKTYRMLEVEKQWGVPVEDILQSGSMRSIEKNYGIPLSTVARWIRRLGLPLVVDVPLCEDCNSECTLRMLCDRGLEELGLESTAKIPSSEAWTRTRTEGRP